MPLPIPLARAFVLALTLCCFCPRQNLIELGFLRSYEGFGRALAWVTATPHADFRKVPAADVVHARTTPLSVLLAEAERYPHSAARVINAHDASEKVSLLTTERIEHGINGSHVLLHLRTLDDEKFKVMTLTSC